MQRLTAVSMMEMVSVGPHTIFKSLVSAAGHGSAPPAGSVRRRRALFIIERGDGRPSNAARRDGLPCPRGLVTRSVCCAQ